MDVPIDELFQYDEPVKEKFDYFWIEICILVCMISVLMVSFLIVGISLLRKNPDRNCEPLPRQLRRHHLRHRQPQWPLPEIDEYQQPRASLRPRYHLPPLEAEEFQQPRASLRPRYHLAPPLDPVGVQQLQLNQQQQLQQQQLQQQQLQEQQEQQQLQLSDSCCRPHVFDNAGECPICFSKPKLGLITNCRHLFCGICLMGYLKGETGRGKRCPMCQQVIDKLEPENENHLVYKQRVCNNVRLHNFYVDYNRGAFPPV